MFFDEFCVIGVECDCILMLGYCNIGQMLIYCGGCQNKGLVDCCVLGFVDCCCIVVIKVLVMIDWYGYEMVVF